MFDIVTLTFSGLMVLLSISPLYPSNHWVFRMWEFVRVQIAILCACVLVASFFITSDMFKVIAISVNFAVLLYQLLWILPYTILYPVQVANPDITQASCRIKILTSNVLMTNNAYHKLLKVIEVNQPDVIVTLETDSAWEKALTPIHDDYPHRVSQALDNLYGMHLYSKFALYDVQVLNLVQEGVPSIHCMMRLREQFSVKCHFLHPAPPSPTENKTATPRDRELMMIAKQVATYPDEVPVIVTGDLNDVAWSPTTRAFRRVSGLQDPRIGRGVFNTFHADYFFVRWPLDHIFHSKHFTLATLRRMPSIDSDHFPLFSELVYKVPAK